MKTQFKKQQGGVNKKLLIFIIIISIGGLLLCGTIFLHSFNKLYQIRTLFDKYGYQESTTDDLITMMEKNIILDSGSYTCLKSEEDIKKILSTDYQDFFETDYIDLVMPGCEVIDDMLIATRVSDTEVIHFEYIKFNSINDITEYKNELEKSWKLSEDSNNVVNLGSFIMGINTVTGNDNNISYYAGKLKMMAKDIELGTMVFSYYFDKTNLYIISSGDMIDMNILLGKLENSYNYGQSVGTLGQRTFKNICHNLKLPVPMISDPDMSMISDPDMSMISDPDMSMISDPDMPFSAEEIKYNSEKHFIVIPVSKSSEYKTLDDLSNAKFAVSSTDYCGKELAEKNNLTYVETTGLSSTLLEVSAETSDAAIIHSSDRKEVGSNFPKLMWIDVTE